MIIIPDPPQLALSTQSRFTKAVSGQPSPHDEGNALSQLQQQTSDDGKEREGIG